VFATGLTVDHNVTMDQPRSLSQFPVHLGLDAAAFALPEFDGTGEWYQHYGESTTADGREGRLVSMHTFTEPWDTWEVHPHGHELVVCISGSMTLHQKDDGGADTPVRTVVVNAGEYVINAPGEWHTADVTGPASALFVTAGLGTENHPRHAGETPTRSE
jgi:mannose-6-phosphate isomerase-like protein (cupin superfamily)